MITLQLDKSTFNNLRALVIEGGKVRETGDNGIIVAAQILLMLRQAEAKASETVECPTLQS